MAAPFLTEAAMHQIAATPQGILRSLRMLYGSLLASIVLYVYVMKLMPVQVSEPLNPLVPWILGVLAAADLSMAQVIRSRKLSLALETLRTKPDDVRALGQWRIGAIISVALASSVALFGLVLHFIGGSTWQVAPFMVAGAVAMLIWWPQGP
jgi:hypothetical protein